MSNFRFFRYVLILIWLGLSSTSYALAPLQLYIEITPSGGVLELPEGRYSGPAIIKKPITINGKGKVEIDGQGDGTVITVKANGTTVRGLRIVNSGRSHNTVDAGVLIEADDALIEDNVIENVLFGIHLKKANENTIRGNKVSSAEGRDISLRGDGLRLWYSYDNLIEKNHFNGVRDLAANNSPDNRFLHNTIVESRIGMEFIYSPGNEIAHNTVVHNTTGIVAIYSGELDIHHNRIAHMRKLTGSGLSLKESPELWIHDNEIAHCNIGLLANSPLDPENRMTAEGNLFTYNVLGIYLYGEKGGHIIRNNRFTYNFTDALGSAPATARKNNWLENAWDSYQGFDRDKDGFGDYPHDVYLFSEHIWNDIPMSRFFRGSPAAELLDFSFRLAPLYKPVLEYSDPRPTSYNTANK